MRLAACCLLAACNQVLGLDDTTRYQKPPPSCPPIGTAPEFSLEIQLAIAQECIAFSASTSAGTAMAQCLVPMGGLPPPVMYGPIDGPLAPIDLPLGNATDMRVFGPVLAPEGDEALGVFESMPGQLELASYLLQSDGTWQFHGYQPMPPAAPITDLSPPSRGPHRHTLYFLNSLLHEAVRDDSGTWSEILPPYDMFPLGASRPHLSPDGLRLVGTVLLAGGGKAVYYADRATIDGRFGAPLPVASVPTAAALFMTPDCGRIYFSGLGNVLYEAQP